MKLKRFITEREFGYLTYLSKKTVLQCDNENKYYHAENMKDNKRVQYINGLLGEIIEGFKSFSNFRRESDLIRLQYNYNYGTNDVSFTGVGYITIKELLNGFEVKEGLVRDKQGS